MGYCGLWMRGNENQSHVILKSDVPPSWGFSLLGGQMGVKGYIYSMNMSVGSTVYPGKFGV